MYSKRGACVASVFMRGDKNNAIGIPGLGIAFQVGFRVDPVNIQSNTSTHLQGTDPRVACGACGELPWIYLGASG